MLTVNAFGVLFFQFPIRKIVEKFDLLSGMRIGALLLIFGYFIFSVSNANFVLLTLAMAIITFRELIISPVQNTVVNNMDRFVSWVYLYLASLQHIILV